MHLSAMGVAAAGTVRVSQLENTPLQDMVKNEQREVWIINCGYWSVLEHHCSTLESHECDFHLLLVNSQYCHHEKQRVNVEQPNIKPI